MRHGRSIGHIFYAVTLSYIYLLGLTGCSSGDDGSLTIVTSSLPNGTVNFRAGFVDTDANGEQEVEFEGQSLRSVDIARFDFPCFPPRIESGYDYLAWYPPAHTSSNTSPSTL